MPVQFNKVSNFKYFDHHEPAVYVAVEHEKQISTNNTSTSIKHAVVVNIPLIRYQISPIYIQI